jgi:hypothetical protein
MMPSTAMRMLKGLSKWCRKFMYSRLIDALDWDGPLGLVVLRCEASHKREVSPNRLDLRRAGLAFWSGWLRLGTQLGYQPGVVLAKHCFNCRFAAQRCTFVSCDDRRR